MVQAYLDAPETVVAEIVDGALSLMPRPRPRHAHAATRLAGEFRPFGNPRGDEPGGWVLLIEPELELGAKPDVPIPDLAGWRRERVPPGFLQADEITLTPDWVCEVISPSTSRFDRKRKLPIYHREGVGHAWLLDPAQRSLEVFRRTPEGWLLVGDHDGADVVRAIGGPRGQPRRPDSLRAHPSLLYAWLRSFACVEGGTPQGSQGSQGSVALGRPPVVPRRGSSDGLTRSGIMVPSITNLSHPLRCDTCTHDRAPP